MRTPEGVWLRALSSLPGAALAALLGDLDIENTGQPDDDEIRGDDVVQKLRKDKNADTCGESEE